MTLLLLAALVQTPLASPRDSYEHRIVASTAGEAVAVINAGCARCDWGTSGREAVLLELSVDGKYSQHLALMRGERVSEYRVLLGSVSAGEHRLSLSRDSRRSAADAGGVTYG